ncbi:glycosyltransferase family 4 protein [Caldicellulosiruptoraceae bacterium PP1]
MKKIWIMNHYAIPPRIGGITRHFDFAEELAKRGYDVTIFASSFDHKTREETLEKGLKYKEEKISNVKFVWIKTTPYKKNDLKRVLNIISFSKNLYFVAKKFENPDTIIASSFHPLTCIVGYLLAKKKNARYIAEIRDIWPQSAIDMGAISENGIIAKTLRLIEDFIYKRAKKIIVLFPKAVDYIISRGYPKDKAIYIPNGTSIERFDQIIKNGKSPDVESILKEHVGYFKALYLGALGRANAMETIVEAAKYVQDIVGEKIHFLIVGDGPEKEKLEKMANELNLKNIYFYQPIKKYDVPLLLNGVDVALISMHNLAVYKYGISLNKLFDYLCSQKPIVFAADVINDIVKEANAGITTKPGDAKQFADAIIKIYNMSDEKRKELGQNGRDYIEKHHDIKVLADRLESIL